jgi:hypothetical protein
MPVVDAVPNMLKILSDEKKLKVAQPGWKFVLTTDTSVLRIGAIQNQI